MILKSAAPSTPSTAPERLSPAVEKTVHLLAQRRLLGPALLFVTSHRPLAFVAGQMLLLADPVAGLLGLPAWDRWAGEWAALLSHPTQPDQVAAALATARDVQGRQT